MGRREKLVKDFGQLSTHARWVAAWWARAFTELSAQATCNQESVTISDLVVEFLNANKVAVKHTTRAGWEYDRHLWADLADRLRRNEPEIDVHSTFRTLDKNDVSEAVSKVAEQVQSKANGATSSQSPPDTSATRSRQTNPSGKGGKAWGSTTGAYDWSSYKGGKPEQFGSGGMAWTGKGGGKMSSKATGKSTEVGKGTSKSSKAGKSTKQRQVKQEK